MSDARKALDNLANALVEDILALSDEEVLAEFIEDGGDPEALAARMRGIFERAVYMADQIRMKWHHDPPVDIPEEPWPPTPGGPEPPEW